jgi:hypothetical protein
LRRGSSAALWIVFLDEAEHFLHNRDASVATLRNLFAFGPECHSPSLRNQRSPSPESSPVVITGCERLEILDQAIELARSFKPLNPAQKAALLAKTQEAARTGDYEPVKTTPMFDGTAQNPAWLG